MILVIFFFYASNDMISNFNYQLARLFMNEEIINFFMKMNIHRSSFKLFVDIEINRMELFLFLFFFYYPSTSRGVSSIIDYKIVVRPIIKKNLITRHSYRILTRILSWRHAINRIQWYSTEKFFPNISKTKANRRIQFIYEKKKETKNNASTFFKFIFKTI